MMNKFFTSRIYSLMLQFVLIIGFTTLIKNPYTKPVTFKAASHIIFIENSWDEALKQAAQQKKYIFVDAYATWCGPCKMLKALTFTNDKAATFYNSNFINVAIDMEKGRGPELAQKWRLQAYPTLIIFDSNGKPVLGSVGYIKPNDLIRFGQQALSKKAQ